jgi:hypothetical protein
MAISAGREARRSISTTTAEESMPEPANRKMDPPPISVKTGEPRKASSSINRPIMKLIRKAL